MDGGDLVLECLESVFAQQGAFRIEVIVHDDASTDDSLARIKDRFPQVGTIDSATNTGFCISRSAIDATGQPSSLKWSRSIRRAVIVVASESY